ncbi:MAG: hypothetical protein PHF06_12010, partial [Sphaerochaeta sp.]|uniref:hypothetical protein n=1 Tax=Sphaerochaeta sp. TaxID=1972642 RepID=UPI0025862AAB
KFRPISVDFVDRVHGTGFLEIRPWRPLSAIPVDNVDFLTGTDGSKEAFGLRDLTIKLLEAC